jgi:transmembrane sensor
MFVDSTQPLADQAIDWLVLARSGDASAEELAALESWLTANEGHRAAYAEAEALWSNVGSALRHTGDETLELSKANRFSDASLGAAGLPSDPVAQPGDKPESIQPRDAKPSSPLRSLGIVGGRVIRHPRLRFGLATAAALFATILLTRPQLLDFWFSDYATGVGQHRQVTLSDGSTILLDTDTALLDHSDAKLRRVDLQRGQAFFQIAPDARRPFEVHAGAVTVRAVGTAFQVNRGDSGELQVTVTEHAVQVGLGGSDSSGAIRVEQGQTFAYPGKGSLGPPIAADLNAITAWRRGKLIFRDRPVAEVVAQLNRYRHGRFVITDPGIGTMRVSGVFPLANLDGSVEILEQSLGIRATKLGPLLTCLHR